MNNLVLAKYLKKICVLKVKICDSFKKTYNFLRKHFCKFFLGVVVILDWLYSKNDFMKSQIKMEKCKITILALIVIAVWATLWIFGEDSKSDDLATLGVGTATIALYVRANKILEKQTIIQEQQKEFNEKQISDYKKDFLFKNYRKLSDQVVAIHDICSNLSSDTFSEGGELSVIEKYVFFINIFCKTPCNDSSLKDGASFQKTYELLKIEQEIKDGASDLELLGFDTTTQKKLLANFKTIYDYFVSKITSKNAYFETITKIQILSKEIRDTFDSEGIEFYKSLLTR